MSRWEPGAVSQAAVMTLPLPPRPLAILARREIWMMTTAEAAALLEKVSSCPLSVFCVHSGLETESLLQKPPIALFPSFPDASLSSSTAEPGQEGVKKRKKRNRWGDAQQNKAAGLMGLPTMIMATMTNEQLEAYTLHLRIEEISQKLRINDVVPADGDR